MKTVLSVRVCSRPVDYICDETGYLIGTPNGLYLQPPSYAEPKYRFAENKKVAVKKVVVYSILVK